MWWLALAACKEETKCPAGFEPSPTGCVRPNQLTPADPEPELVVVPEVLELGTVHATCDTEGTFQIRNDGDAELEITGVSYTSTHGDLALDSDTLPLLPTRLAPGTSFEVTIRLTGVEPRADQGTLTVVSSDVDAATTYASSGVIDAGEILTEVHPAPEPLADILLLVDTSCSMFADNIDDVTAGIPEMLTALDAAADWQLAVTSRADGCTNLPLVTDSNPATAQAIVDSIFTQPYNPLGESLFALASQALGHASDCNAGMLRQGSQLHLVVISDEWEQSGTSWQTWVATFEAYSATFVVSAVVDVYQACGDGTGAVGYQEAASATGGVVLDVCQPSWGPELHTITDAIEGGVVGPIPLDRTPDEESITVSVGGREVDSFHYNASRNSVEDILPPPTPGDDVTISYRLPVACD